MGVDSSNDKGNLLVGNDVRDDAAVVETENGQCIISTTDFFMPIVDDPYDFGRIAATNAISDVYAMGGKPLVAISIFGWPIDKLPPEVGREVIRGGQDVCKSAGISLAGGHSIDSPEPIFGLAVTGTVLKEHLKQNSTAQVGDYIYITKPLGIGILSTAQKKKILKAEHTNIARDWMVILNSIGEKLGKKEYVHALTDVTGFGLAGHLSEICEGSGTTGVIEIDQVPLIDQVEHYLKLGSIPGGTVRNWNSYGSKIGGVDDQIKPIICDPQTSGGLLVIIDPEKALEFESFMKAENTFFKKVGSMKDQEIIW